MLTALSILALAALVIVFLAVTYVPPASEMQSVFTGEYDPEQVAIGDDDIV